MEGFVWALVILGAIRLGRRQAEDTFLDYDAIRVKQVTRMHQAQRGAKPNKQLEKLSNIF